MQSPLGKSDSAYIA